MTRQTALDGILRFVDSSRAPKGPGERLVTFHAERGEPITGFGIFAPKKHFVINHNNSVQQTTLVTLADVGNNDKLEIKVNCQLSCPHNQDAALRNLVVADNPADAFSAMVRQVASELQDELRDRGEPVVKNFFDHQGEWRQRFKKKLGEKSGLICDVDFAFELDAVAEISVSDKFSLSIENAPEEEPAVSYQVRLDLSDSPEAQNTAMRMVGRTTELRARIRESVQKWFRNNAKSLNDFYSENNVDRYRDAVLKCVEVAAAEHGRRIGKFSYDLEYPFDPPRPVSQEFAVDCRAKDATRTTPITFRTLLRCNNLDLYRRSKRGDIAVWSQEYLTDYVRTECQKLTQAELAHRFRSTIVEKLEREFQELCGQVGYKVEQLDVVAKVDEDEFFTLNAPFEFSHTIKVESKSIPVKHEIKLRLDDRETYLASGIKHAETRDWVERKLQYVTQEVLLDKSYLDLAVAFDSDPQLSGRLKQEFRQAAAEVGLGTEFHLPSVTAPLHEHFYKSATFVSEHDVDISHWPEQIPIRHNVLIRIEDEDKYRKSGILNVEEWAARQLQEITQSKLFDASYVAVATEFRSRIEGEIKSAFQQLASSKGLKVQQFSSITKIITEELITNGFHLELNDREFPTRQSGVRVKLDLVLSGRLPQDLKSVSGFEKYLMPGKNLKEEIVNRAEIAINQAMNRIDPIDFYLTFERPKSTMQSDLVHSEGRQTSVEERLRKAIAEILEAEFGMSESLCQITVKQANTNLMDRWKELQKQREGLDFNFVITPRGGTALEFHVSYVIDNIDTDNWPVFQNCVFDDVPSEIRAITNTLREGFISRMDHTLRREFVEYNNEPARVSLLRAVFEGNAEFPGVGRLIQEQHGLVVKIGEFRRVATEQEVARGRATSSLIESEYELVDLQAKQQVQELKRKFEEIASLQKRIEEMRHGDPEAEEIQLWEKQVAKLQNQIREVDGGTRYAIGYDPSGDQTNEEIDEFESQFNVNLKQQRIRHRRDDVEEPAE